MRTGSGLARRGAGGFLPGRVRGAVSQSLIRLGSLLGVLLFALFSFTGPAYGHAELASSSPKDGARLDAAPKAVTFKFGEKLLPAGNAITVTDTETGQRLKLGAVKVDGRKLSVAWPKSAPAGKYRVAYRAVSADGHPITGRIVFTFSKPSPAAVAEPITPSDSRTADTAAALGTTRLQYPVDSTALVWVVVSGFVGLVVAGLAAVHNSRRAR
ncbi:MAG: copper resistance CopC family protein [Candidatus Nanopelagicales bacterium]